MADDMKTPNSVESDGVGYGKPPKHTQFKKGESGNPKGRPKGAKILKTDDQVSVADVLNEPIKATAKDGKIIEMSPFEAGLRKLVESALKDKVLRSVKDFLEICEDCGVLKVDPGLGGGVVHVPKGMSFEDWHRTLEDPSFKPILTDYGAFIKKHTPEKLPAYLKKKADKRAEEERLAKEEKQFTRQSHRSRLYSKRSGGQNKKTIVRQVAMEKHSVAEGGKRRRRTTMELVVLTLRNMAIANRPRGALREFLKWDERARPKDGQTVGIMVAHTPLDDDEWIAEQMEKNLHRKPPPGIEDLNSGEN